MKLSLVTLAFLSSQATPVNGLIIKNLLRNSKRACFMPSINETEAVVNPSSLMDPSVVTSAVAQEYC